MVHQHFQPNAAGFRDSALRDVERRTAASYERELSEGRSREVRRLREALADEKALVRQKDELIRHREVLSREAQPWG